MKRYFLFIYFLCAHLQFENINKYLQILPGGDDEKKDEKKDENVFFYLYIFLCAHSQFENTNKYIQNNNGNRPNDNTGQPDYMDYIIGIWNAGNKGRENQCKMWNVFWGIKIPPWGVWNRLQKHKHGVEYVVHRNLIGEVIQYQPGNEMYNIKINTL
ncbi:MAG: hypothetical protein GY737_08140, partial [Desulfobacteraceae bacterium]|nr:hypothetical protein [Desulfobacteraceae bacterium]